MAELEAQVEALTKLLESQNIQPEQRFDASGENTPQALVNGSAPSRSRSGTATTSSISAQQPKKRRLEDDYSPQPSDTESSNDRRLFIELDTVLPQHIQEKLLSRYLRVLVPYFPAVPIAGDQSYTRLRKERPLLLQSAIYCASFGALPLEKQEDVGKVVMDLFAAKAMGEGEKSAELIQVRVDYDKWSEAICANTMPGDASSRSVLPYYKAPHTYRCVAIHRDGERLGRGHRHRRP